MNWKVTTQPGGEPVTLDEAKDHIRVESSFTADDDLINALITSARQWAENYLWRAIPEQTITLKRMAFANRMELPMTNLISVDSVKYLDEDGAGQTLSTDVYGVDTYATPGAVYLKDGQEWPDVDVDPLAVEIVYKAGWEASDSPLDYGVNVPQPIKQGILLIIGHLYENREETIVGTSAQELPMGAKSLLYPYRTLGL